MTNETSRYPGLASLAVAAATLGLVAGTAQAQFQRCRDDQVKAGSVCIDKYEASVWSIPDPTGANKALVRKLQKGKATVTDLTNGGATQLGVASDDYTCADNGQDCKDAIFAASLPGVTPSAYITWFQAQAACANALKKLPSNTEWQQGVLGTPDPGPDNGSTDCNSQTFVTEQTGSRSACVSSWGAYDMVGNLYEWVADWVPASTVCPGWGGFSNDDMCLSGASTSATGPGALLRGGSASGLVNKPGPLDVNGQYQPWSSSFAVGFRCAR